MLSVAAVAGGGLALTWLTREKDSLAESTDTFEPNAFLQITPDGRVIFQLDKVELGQGTMTGLTTLIAEELDFAPARIEVRFAPVRSFFQRPMQMTGQSRSMSDSWEPLRETGAVARTMLLTAAAKVWGVATDSLQTDDGFVIDPETGRRTAYADLAATAATLQAPWFTRFKDPADYRWIGKHVPRLDLHAKVTGAAVYGIDVCLDGMLTAVLARCPELDATLIAYDSKKAAALPGVRGIVELGNAVAVVATDFWTAHKAARLIELEWQPGSLAGKSDAAISAELLARFDQADPDYSRADGEPAAQLGVAATVVEAQYQTPYLAHATMEPMNATAHVRADSCDLWVPSQTPDMAQNIAAELTGLSRAQVNVHTTYIGGGFGRRVLWDYVIEAVLVAREFDVPVKLVWTREDDLQHGYFRQRTMHRLRGGLDAAGAALAWEHRQVATPTANALISPSVRTMFPEVLEPETRKQLGKWVTRQTISLVAAFQAREGAEKLIYDFPAMSFSQFAHDPGVPVSIWRSVGNSYNGFVVESFIDELAHAAEQEPAEFRRQRLTDPRHMAVFDKLLELAGWGQSAAGHAQGIALFEAYGTVVGQVADVSINPSSAQPICVHKVVCVVECGRVINPDIVKAQMQSGIIFGLTAALYGEINIDNGRVRQSNFHDYRMLRMHDAPDVEVSIIDSDRDPSGVGEPGLPPIAPAVANAVFALTGQRLRSLPLTLSAVTV
jgi:isoquinoline 1-oxidoreductase/isoquinoline 1-oxidoreductase beta subunit